VERGASGGVAGDEQERTGTMSAHVEVLKTWASFTAYAENLDVGSTFQSTWTWVRHFSPRTTIEASRVQTSEGSVRRYFGGCFDGARSRPRRQFMLSALRSPSFRLGLFAICRHAVRRSTKPSAESPARTRACCRSSTAT
jgi:hypothetical protein